MGRRRRSGRREREQRLGRTSSRSRTACTQLALGATLCHSVSWILQRSERVCPAHSARSHRLCGPPPTAFSSSVTRHSSACRPLRTLPLAPSSLQRRSRSLSGCCAPSSNAGRREPWCRHRVCHMRRLLFADLPLPSTPSHLRSAALPAGSPVRALPDEFTRHLAYCHLRVFERAGGAEAEDSGRSRAAASVRSERRARENSPAGVPSVSTRGCAQRNAPLHRAGWLAARCGRFSSTGTA